MHTLKRRITGIALGAFAMNALTLSLAPAAYAADLKCTPKVYNTAASATCTGRGEWRLRIDCKNQKDYVGDWIIQKNGTTTATGECKHQSSKSLSRI
jgi:hypothetical protein